MKLVNLHNSGRHIYKFIREDSGELLIEKDSSFYPYYFEPSNDGEFVSYLGGKSYRKVFATEPRDIRKQSSPEALGIDVSFTKNYLLDKKIVLERTNPKIFFIDIEIKTSSMPKEGDYSKPISSIAVYNYHNKTSKVFFIGDYYGTTREKEKIILTNFSSYIRNERPDILLFWNGYSFDLPYLTGRYKNWAKDMSPVGENRYGYRTDIGEFINYPVGISVMDYMEMFKKYTRNTWPAYNLNAVLEQEFGEGKQFHDVDFNVVNEELRERNRHDVIDMSRLEDKYNLVDFFQEQKILTYSDWEDLPSRTSKKFGKIVWNSNNSRLVDSYFLKKAKDCNVILPNKPRDTSDTEYDGAFREVFETGVHFNLHKLDFDGMYPRQIMDFNLDSLNFVNSSDILNNKEGLKFDDYLEKNKIVPISVTTRELGEFKELYYVKQNSEALLPSIIRELLSLKDYQKKELKNATPDTPEYSLLEVKYKATKSFINSCYGVFGNPYFRMYDKRIAETTTYLSRSLVLYLIEKAKQDKQEFVYSDTDSLFLKGSIDYIYNLNKFIVQWGKEYGVSLSAKLDLDGTYDSIILIAKCRYYGRLQTPNGLKEDKCGIEALRNDSTKYMKVFQMELLNKILDGNTRSDILKWIVKERDNIKSVPLKEIAKPVRVQDKEYKTVKIQNGKEVKMPPPPSVRARLNANKVLKKQIGFADRFFLVNMLPFGQEATGHPAIHIGFKDNTDHIDRNKIDWKKITELNIDNKAKKIFEVMKWEYNVGKQLELFI